MMILLRILCLLLFFFNKLILLFRRDVLNEQKVKVKTYIVIKDFHFEQILLFFFTSYPLKNQRKKFQKTI